MQLYKAERNLFSVRMQISFIRQVLRNLYRRNAGGATLWKDLKPNSEFCFAKFPFPRVAVFIPRSFVTMATAHIRTAFKPKGDCEEIASGTYDSKTACSGFPQNMFNDDVSSFEGME